MCHASVTFSVSWVHAVVQHKRATLTCATMTSCPNFSSYHTSLYASQRSCLVCRLRCAPASPPPRLCWHTFACLPGPPSMRGCSSYGPGPILPQRTCLRRMRLILFCTCPPLCAGVLRPMPACVWRDVRSVLCVFFFMPPPGSPPPHIFGPVVGGRDKS